MQVRYMVQVASAKVIQEIRWGYDFAGLTLQVGDSVKCIPTHVTKFTCRLDVLVEGSVKKLPPQGDPVTTTSSTD